MTLLQRVEAAFLEAHGRAPALVVRAPGRVNLIGEHTDYNDGFVLPCAIDFQTLVAAAPRSDGRFRVVAADHGSALDEFDAGSPIAHHPQGGWPDYVRGVMEVLRRRGIALPGADLAIAGDVPQGAGLSSSAALQVALVHTLNQLLGLALDKTAQALIAQQAENDFVGCRCGIMDQLASACGEAQNALLIDCRSLQTRPVPLPAGLSVMIVHSRIARGLVDSAYNERRAQCEAAARHYGVKALRDLDLADLEAGAPGLDPLTLRRARHVVTENARTLAAAEALRAGQLRELGRLMAESHASMRSDFEITTPALDGLVEVITQAVGIEGGARMTGGGFGGCVVALLPEARVSTVQAAVAQHYRSPQGRAASVWTCTAQAGVSAVTGC